MKKNPMMNYMICTISIVLIIAIVQIIIMRKQHKEMMKDLESCNNQIQVLEERKNDLVSMVVQYRMQMEESTQKLQDVTNELTRMNLKETLETSEFSYDFGYVVKVVATESRDKSIDVMLGIAQCIADVAGRTGMSPEEVVKYTGRYCEPDKDLSYQDMESVDEACLMIFSLGVRPYTEPIEFFSKGENEDFEDDDSLVLCYDIEGVKFFKSIQE